MAPLGMSESPAPAPFNWDERRVPKWFLRAVIYVMLVVTAFSAARSVVTALNDLLVMLVVSLFLSFAIEPAVDWLADRGWRRGPATGLVFLITAVIVGVFTWLMVSLVVEQVRSLVDDAPNQIRSAARWINHRFGTHITTDNVVEQLRKYQNQLASTATDLGGRVLAVTSSALGVVFKLLTVALFTFYLVADGPKIRANLGSMLPPNRQRVFLGLWELAISKTGGYLYSRLLIATVTFTTCSIGFSIIGVPSPVALALWTGVIGQFVPVIGTYIGGALPVLIALVTSPPKALAVIILLIVYQQLEIYLLAPKVTARTMAIHPAVAFGSALAGVELLGPVGALLALPAAAIVQAFVSSYIHRYELIPAISLAPDPDFEPVDAEPEPEPEPAEPD